MEASVPKWISEEGNRMISEEGNRVVDYYSFSFRMVVSRQACAY